MACSPLKREALSRIGLRGACDYKGRVPMRTVLGLGVLMLCCTAQAQPSVQHELPWAAAERYQLENGLEVILQRDPTAAEVAVLVSYRTGMLDDPEGLSGLAHLVEHMTYRRSQHTPALAQAIMPESWGASYLQGATSFEHTDYFQVVPQRQLERSLWLEAERMAFTLPAMTGKDLERERAIVAKEAQLREAQPLWGVEELIDEHLYPEQHPYRAVEWEESAYDDATLDDVRWFFQRGYRPDNASLVIVGDFDTDRTKQAVAKYFGPIGNPARPRVGGTLPAVTLEGTATMRITTALLTERLRLIWWLPVLQPPDDSTLLLLTHVLNSRFEVEMVRERKLASDVSFTLERGGGGQKLIFSATIARGHEGGELLKAATAAFQKLQRSLLSNAAFASIRNGARWELLRSYENTTYRAMLLAHERPEQHAAPLFDLRRTLADIRQLTPAALRDFTARTMPMSRVLIVRIHPSYNGGIRVNEVTGDTRPRLERR